jgi:hypothetical protein
MIFLVHGPLLLDSKKGKHSLTNTTVQRDKREIDMQLWTKLMRNWKARENYMGYTTFIIEMYGC